MMAEGGGHIVFLFSVGAYVGTCVRMYVLWYKCVRDPVRLRLRHLYQVEFCSFIVRYPTAGASMYCGHVSSTRNAFAHIQEVRNALCLQLCTVNVLKLHLSV